MFSGKIIGRVVCTRKDESLEGTKLLLIQPMTWEGEVKGDPLVAIDSVGSGANEFIFYVKAREAAVADPRVPPVDAAVVGIIDGVEVKIRE